MANAYELRLAREADLSNILALISGASEWLAGKGTDQWQRPWPDDAARLARMRAGIAAGKTWILVDGHTHIATITVDWQAVTPGLPTLWNEEERAEPAVYDHRVAVLRDSGYAGSGLGVRLLDWTGRLAAEAYGARFVRLDAWTSNSGLHKYYKSVGFDKKRTYEEEVINCPSGALFEKPLDRCAGPAHGIAVDPTDIARWTAVARAAHSRAVEGREA